MDVTMIRDRYGRTTQYTNGVLTHRVSSTGSPQPDGSLNKAVRMKMVGMRLPRTGRTWSFSCRTLRGVLVCLLTALLKMLNFILLLHAVTWLGAFSQERQSLWLPKDNLKDSSTWSSPPLVLLHDIHDSLLD